MPLQKRPVGQKAGVLERALRVDAYRHWRHGGQVFLPELFIVAAIIGLLFLKSMAPIAALGAALLVVTVRIAGRSGLPPPARRHACMAAAALLSSIPLSLLTVGPLRPWLGILTFGAALWFLLRAERLSRQPP